MPTSSTSAPERVLPSLMNCTASVAGLLGPSESSNFALRDPEPTKTRQNEKLVVLQEQDNVPKILVVRSEPTWWAFGSIPSSSPT